MVMSSMFPHAPKGKSTLPGDVAASQNHHPWQNDIVSSGPADVDNAVNTAKREVDTRYDLRGSNSESNWTRRP